LERATPAGEIQACQLSLAALRHNEGATDSKVAGCAGKLFATGVCQTVSA
jgi:hypothetical protein